MLCVRLPLVPVECWFLWKVNGNGNVNVERNVALGLDCACVDDRLCEVLRAVW